MIGHYAIAISQCELVSYREILTGCKMTFRLSQKVIREHSRISHMSRTSRMSQMSRLSAVGGLNTIDLTRGSSTLVMPQEKRISKTHEMATSFVRKGP